jgi:transmembrane sensor
MTERNDLARALREPHDEARAHRNWEAIERRRHRTPAVPMARGLWSGAVLLGVAAAVALAIGLGEDAPGPLRAADGHAAHGVLTSERVRLDDGSVIALTANARLEVLENAGDHVRFWLHDGEARFDVVPGGPRRWVIETGLVTVEVLGTAFTVARGEGSVRVAVERGSVLVTAPEEMRRLHAGEEMIVELPAAHETLAAAPSPAPSGSPSPEPEPSVSPPPSPVASVAPAPPAPRLRDVDALRAAGRIDDAIAMLETIEQDAGAGSERALAAFTRGRLELDRRDHPRDAADAFEHAIALGLRAPLVEDARARRVEALARAGDGAAAREAAQDYTEHHPNGRWQADVERWLASP